MDGQSTNITYERVRSGANTISECAKSMQNIFSDFGASMKRVGAEDVFVGDASESLGNRFNSLKTKFDDYVRLVDEFAAMLTGASEATARTEKALAAEADSLRA